ncbi:MAG: iron transporter [Bacteroidetes bacterium]|nr:iron transporter [Bacteroidota bacterium]
MHQEKHFQSSDLVRDIIIGMADGLTVPFALAAGLSGAAIGSSLVTTAGLAEIAAGSIAMGLGGYLAGVTDVQHYASERQREYDEVEQFPEKEKHEVMEILTEYGLSEESSQLVVDNLSKDKDRWVNFMMRFELGMEEPDKSRASKSALAIGLSYIVGGLIPLAPYFFTENSEQGLMISAAVTVVALFVFGALKSRVMQQPVLAGAIKVVMIGVVAAAAAFGIAKWVG